jgi:hypothetical protein
MDWELPSLADDSWSDTGSWSAAQNDSFELPSSYDQQTFAQQPDSQYLGNTDFSNAYQEDWYTDSLSGGEVDTSMFNDLWNWAKTNQGTSVLGGAVNQGMNLWKADLLNDMRDDNDAARLEIARMNNATQLEIANMQNEIAKRREDRVDKHNSSINTPMNMGITKLQR